MKSAIQTGQLSSWGQRYPLRVLNLTLEPIPAFAIMQISSSPGVNAQLNYFTVTKPVGGSGQLCVNSPNSIAPNGFGAAAVDGLLTAGYNVFDGAPQFGDEWGPHPFIPGWLLSVSGKGFAVIGGVDPTTNPATMRVSPMGTNGRGNTSGDYPIIKIKNVSGGTLVNRSIVGISTALTIPPVSFDIQPTFESKVAKDKEPFAVLISDLANNAVGDAVPNGLIVSAKINYTLATHTYVEVTGGSFGSYDVFQSEIAGRGQIVWREKQTIAGAGTLGVQWAFVLLSPQTSTDDIRGMSYGTIAAATGTQTGAITPGTGLAKLYTMPTGAAGAVWQPETNPVTVENWMFGSIAIYKPLLLRVSRTSSAGTKIYTVVSEGCAAIPSG